MADKGMDPQVVMKTVTRVMEEILSKMTGIVPTAPAESKELDIDEFDGRMRAAGTEKFSTPSYIGVVNYYLTAKDEERQKPKGSLVLYLDSEFAGKFYKSLGIKAADDEDDMSMMTACGELCNLVAANFKKELLALGYNDLYMSEAHNYKNNVMHGVEYSQDQDKKCEISFFYFKRKAIIVEATMAVIPSKK